MASLPVSGGGVAKAESRGQKHSHQTNLDRHATFAKARADYKNAPQTKQGSFTPQADHSVQNLKKITRRGLKDEG